MKYELLKIIWRDVTYSEALLSKEEAPDKMMPTNIVTLGFKINEDSDKISLSQTYNLTRNTFIKTTTIPKKLIVSIDGLLNSESKGETENNIAVVQWHTDNSYFTKGYTKAKAEDLVPMELITIGFIVPQEEYYSLFFEKEEDGSNLTRSEQCLYKSDIKSLEYFE